MYGFTTPTSSPTRPTSSSSAVASAAHVEEDALDAPQLSDLFSRFGLSETDEGGEEGFLRKALNGCNNKDDLWQLATSLPKAANQVTKFDTLFARFVELVNESLPLFTLQNENTVFSKLPNALNEVLFGSNGVYYTVTSRNPNNCDKVFTAHQAHNVLFEVHTGSTAWGVDHRNKAQGTVNSLEKTIKNMQKILKYIDKRLRENQLQELISMLNDFIQYLGLHEKLMRVSLAYKQPNTDLNKHNSPIKPDSRGKELMDEWHTTRVDSTPQKGKIPAHMRFSQAKATYAAAASVDEAPIASRTRSSCKRPKI